MPYPITTIEEYNLCINRGYLPLLDTKNFEIEIGLRISIQRELFGVLEVGRMKANQKFYKWVWNNKRHICEETMQPLRHYSSSFISHILAKGAYPEMEHDPRNINILTFEMHNKWENGKREEMRIFKPNQKRIEMLTLEYQKFYEISK